MCELTDYDSEKVTKDRLYDISRKLYEEKAGLENHLSRCTNELFNLQDKIIDTDNYLWVKSQAKTQKKNSMNQQFTRRFDEGIRAIQKGIVSKGGIKKTAKVCERIGRLKEKYSSTHQYYQITVSDNGKGTATNLDFERKAGTDIDDKAGIYFLRTSLNGREEKYIG